MSLSTLTRRATLLITAALLNACALLPSTAPKAEAPALPPIVFVHGNGDTAALWLTTLWRFESNGWPRERLHAVDMPYPLARDADDKAQPGRSSTADALKFLTAEVDAVLQRTGAKQVVLIGNSRGGYAIRNYIASGNAAKVSHAILGGTPNHGVWSSSSFRPANEFNGAGPFLTRLNNQGGPGIEITPGPKWMTIRSDNNDKFAQADGVWIGAKGTPTNVTAAGPELKGAENVVIPGIDHRETAFGPKAFAAMFRFLTGREPATSAAAAEARVTLSGKISGLGLDNRAGSGNFANNLPLAGASVEVYATDAATGQRLGPALHRQTVGADGRWGPLVTTSKTALEFVISAEGFAVTHIYRTPFARSSEIVNLRAERIADADKDAPAVVTLTRPRGYFGIPRDEIELDGRSPPAGIPPGVAGVSVAKARLADAADRPVPASFNGQRIVGRAWPTAGNHVVLLELHD
ncbi:alpha/beta fold hydrolase [Variovorax sp. YR752]|uniref:alpha/beta fold hydrolase n=1 Tax=Variovorax sp. YR752 TaxID=1884383 RepID=UPI0031381003